MKIYAVTEDSKPFVSLSTGKAFSNLSSYYDCEVQVKDFNYWRNREIDSDSGNDVVVIFESVYLELAGMSTRDLREYYPNAKFVAMGSDTIYYLVTNKNNGYQFDSPFEVDLFLEKMEDCIDQYRARGINVDHWMWTASDWLLDYVQKFDEGKKFEEKENDFIGLYAPHTIQRPNSYRNKMVNFLASKGKKFTQGGGSGHDDPDVDKIFQQYANIKFTLGSTSHDNPLFHGMKGFRDWIGPHMGSMLIYDDYPDVRKHFQGGELVPLYEYGVFEGILAIHDHYSQNTDQYYEVIEHQKAWALDNTIEKQLVKLFTKHGIIDESFISQPS